MRKRMLCAAASSFCVVKTPDTDGLYREKICEYQLTFVDAIGIMNKV